MDIKKIAILDTSYFIKLKPLEADTIYITTEYIVRELKDEKVNKIFIFRQGISINWIKNLSWLETQRKLACILVYIQIKKVNKFAKKAGDLSSLSIPDISLIALAYELYLEKGQESTLRKEPIMYKVENIEIKILEKPKKKKKVLDWDEEYETPQIDNQIQTNDPITNANIIKNEDTNSKQIQDESEQQQISQRKEEKVDNIIKKEQLVVKEAEIKNENENEKIEENDDDWITLDNIDKKLNTNTFLNEDEKEDKTKEKISIITSDFAVQNISLKMGILINSIDGIKIQRIKNYILKCYSCNTFNFDTSRLFCEFCGYTTLMKIGYYVSSDGSVVIKDKEAESRLRGTQVNIYLMFGNVLLD